MTSVYVLLLLLTQSKVCSLQWFRHLSVWLLQTQSFSLSAFLLCVCAVNDPDCYDFWMCHRRRARLVPHLIPCLCSDLDLHHFQPRLVSPSNSLASWCSKVVHSLFFRLLLQDSIWIFCLHFSDFLRPLEPLFLYKYPRSEPTLSVVSALGSQNLGLSVSHTGGMCITQQWSNTAWQLWESTVLSAETDDKYDRKRCRSNPLLHFLSQSDGL